MKSAKSLPSALGVFFLAAIGLIPGLAPAQILVSDFSNFSESGNLLTFKQVPVESNAIPAKAGITLSTFSFRLGLNEFQSPAVGITGNRFASHFIT